MEQERIDAADRAGEAEREIGQRIVGVFTEMVRLAGLPPSIGSIYGLLFVQGRPMHMDDLIGRLGISKGSVSQGLRVLRSLGAVDVRIPPGERREHYVAATELKRIVAAFVQSRVMPQLEAGLAETRALEPHLDAIDPGRREFLRERLERLAKWQRRGRQALGLLHRFLD